MQDEQHLPGYGDFHPTSAVSRSIFIVLKQPQENLPTQAAEREIDLNVLQTQASKGRTT
jgi:hypothetical protein